MLKYCAPVPIIISTAVAFHYLVIGFPEYLLRLTLLGFAALVLVLPGIALFSSGLGVEASEACEFSVVVVVVALVVELEAGGGDDPLESVFPSGTASIVSFAPGMGVVVVVPLFCSGLHPG